MAGDHIAVCIPPAKRPLPECAWRSTNATEPAAAPVAKLTLPAVVVSMTIFRPTGLLPRVHVDCLLVPTSTLLCPVRVADSTAAVPPAKERRRW